MYTAPPPNQLPSGRAELISNLLTLPRAQIETSSRTPEVAGVRSDGVLFMPIVKRTLRAGGVFGARACGCGSSSNARIAVFHRIEMEFPTHLFLLLTSSFFF